MSIEGRINDALRQLGEEHRLGMIKTEEFRSRRRALLESWGDRDATTSPGSSSRSTTQTNPAIAARSVVVAEPTTNKATWVLGAIALVVGIGGAGWHLLRSKPAGIAASIASTVAPRSEELLAVMREATAFRVRNRWESEDTDAFIALWRTLPPADRQRAQQEPSLQSLRYELEQNIRAERQANEVNPSPEGQQRLDRLDAVLGTLAEDGS